MDGLQCKAIRPEFPPEEIDVSPQRKNHGVFIEWTTLVQTPLFESQTGTFTTHGFFVCLLSQTMVVLSKNAESFQVVQRLIQWHGFTTDGRWHDCGSHFGKQYIGGLFDSGGHGGQRMERFKKNRFKVDMSRFAFTTYAKALIELRTYVRGLPFEGLEGFLIKMQTLNDTIIDFTPPLPKRCVQDYHRQFFYQPVGARCYVNGCHRPLMSKSYWVEKDKKRNPHSPTLLYSEPCPRRKRKRKRRTRMKR